MAALDAALSTAYGQADKVVLLLWGGALLVCAKGAAQQVKDAVELLKEKYR